MGSPASRSATATNWCLARPQLQLAVRNCELYEVPSLATVGCQGKWNSSASGKRTHNRVDA
eukprot:10070852-Lingulodinium_polyedra.AAC.1